MPYAKTKDNRLVNEVTLGDGYPLSNDKQPLKVGGEASIINVSSPTPDGSVDGEVEVKGKLKAKDTVIQGDLKVFSNSGNQPQYHFDTPATQNCLMEIENSGNSNTTLRLRNNQGYFDLKRQYSSTSLQFTDGTNTPLTLDGGNVGIGTSSPDSPLHIQYDNSSGEGAVHSNFNNVGLQIENTNASGVAAIQLRSSDSDGYILYDDDGPNEGNFHFKTDGQDGASVLTLQDGGNVGIGTESPTTTLDVEGTVSYKHTAFSTAGPTDSIDVSDTTVLEVDTSGGSVTIGGFTGGVQGQILYVVKTTSDAYTLKLENSEGGGSQDIFSSDNSDISLVRIRGGVTLYCNGTSWFVLNK